MTRLTFVRAVALGGLLLLTVASCGGSDDDSDRLPDPSESLDSGGGGAPDAGPATDTAGGSDACVPQCTDRVCGPDGCGGVCGACTDPCTGAINVPGLCVDGQCGQPCGELVVTVKYEGDKALDQVTAYLYPDTACGASAFDPAAATATSAPVSALEETLSLAPASTSAKHTVVARATGPDGVALMGCTSGVVASGASTPVQVNLKDSPPVFEGTWQVDSELDLTGILPPSVGKVVAVLDEMTDDHDLLNEDETNGQYGQDPAAFVLDFLYRQICCWEATGPEPSWDSCKDQEVQHPPGDISAIYLNDFTIWPGAWPLATGLCGALEVGVNELLQAILMEAMEAYVPDIATFVVNIPNDLTEAIRHMSLGSELTLAKATGVTANPAFQHRLLALKVQLHDLSGVAHTVEIDLAGAGLTPATLLQEGSTTVVGATVALPLHSFHIDLGKVLSHTYTSGLLPLLGYATTVEMLASWIDCADLGVKLEDKVPDLGFLDEGDYEGFCEKGLEEAAEFIEEGIADATESSTLLELEGTAKAGTLGVGGLVITLVDGVWSGTWKEGDSEGAFPGTFVGQRKQ